MPRLLALEWDAREARLAVGRTTGRDVVVELATAVGLGVEDDVADDTIVDRLTAALTETGLGNCETLVAVPRGKTELRVLQTPPAPDDELPEMVRFQALRQFSSLGEDWPLDFVKLDSGDEDQVQILAAALSPKIVEEIRDSCAACQTPPKKLILRPFATASLFNRRGGDGRCRLLVELLSQEVDLTVLVDGQVAFLRSVRLSAEHLSTALVGEIRRTIAAAQNQLGEHRIEAVTLVGTQENDAELRTTLADQLGLDVQLLDPFAGTELGSSLQDALPRHSGRYAALLGMLHDEAEGRAHGIDFLNPRRKPDPPDPRRRYAIFGAAAAALVLLVIGAVWWYLASHDKQIATLKATQKSLTPTVDSANDLREEVEEIDAFMASGINWLDEMYELSEELPSAEEAVIDKATFTWLPTRGNGQMTLEGHFSDSDVIKTIETELRDSRHQVQGGGTKRDERRPDYPWVCKIEIGVQPSSEIEEPDNE